MGVVVTLTWYVVESALVPVTGAPASLLLSFDIISVAYDIRFFNFLLEAYVMRTRMYRLNNCSHIL